MSSEQMFYRNGKIAILSWLGVVGLILLSGRGFSTPFEEYTIPFQIPLVLLLTLSLAGVVQMGAAIILKHQEIEHD